MADAVDELVVCLAVEAGTPRVPSYVDVCSVCSVDVWRSERSRGHPAPLICLTCFVAAARAEPDVVTKAAPWVAQDLADAYLAELAARSSVWRRQRRSHG